jgi:hypothetical protein
MIRSAIFSLLFLQLVGGIICADDALVGGDLITTESLLALEQYLPSQGYLEHLSDNAANHEDFIFVTQYSRERYIRPKTHAEIQERMDQRMARLEALGKLTEDQLATRRQSSARSYQHNNNRNQQLRDEWFYIYRPDLIITAFIEGRRMTFTIGVREEDGQFIYINRSFLPYIEVRRNFSQSSYVELIKGSVSMHMMSFLGMTLLEAASPLSVEAFTNARLCQEIPSEIGTRITYFSPTPSGYQIHFSQTPAYFIESGCLEYRTDGSGHQDEIMMANNVIQRQWVEGYSPVANYPNASAGEASSTYPLPKKLATTLTTEETEPAGELKRKTTLSFTAATIYTGQSAEQLTEMGFDPKAVELFFGNQLDVEAIIKSVFKQDFDRRQKITRWNAKRELSIKDPENLMKKKLDIDLEDFIKQLDTNDQHNAGTDASKRLEERKIKERVDNKFDQLKERLNPLSEQDQ